MNIRFNYLYRDAGNYKEFGAVTFRGSARRTLVELEAKLNDLLIEGEWFVAREAGVPDLRPAFLNPEMDHDWHEFESLEECADPPDDEHERTITEFIASLGQTARVT